MATNRDLLKEAVADAKTVKDMAIANAKAALEESFTPKIASMFSQKLQEMEDEDEKLDEEMEYEGLEESEEEDLNLEELLRELEDETEGEDPVTEVEDEESEMEDEESEMEDEESEDEEEEVEDDELRAMIEDVIMQMVAADKLEAGPELEDGEIEDEDVDFEEEEEVDLEELLAEIESLDEMDEEESLNEEEELEELFGKKGSGGTSFVKDFLAKNSTEVEKIKGLGGDSKSRLVAAKPLIIKFMKENSSKMDAGAMRSDISVLRSAMGIDELGGSTKSSVSTSESLEAAHEELAEAYKVIKFQKEELNEINLLNAKLLYSNKIFKAKNLTESQKVKVLTTFDKASNVKEVKLVFETLNGSFNSSKKPIIENRGSASSASGIKPKTPIIKNDAFDRMREIAFYDMKH